jgi:hypothetical protein
VIAIVTVIAVSITIAATSTTTAISAGKRAWSSPPAGSPAG